MIRTLSISIIAVAFLPIALILILFGINRVNPSRRNGFSLKLALLVNSSLVLVTSYSGCCGKPGDVTVPLGCYMPPSESDFTDIPANFEKSSDWKTLENWLIRLENNISGDDYDSGFLERFGETVWPAIEKLREDGLITNDDADILTAYCESRRAYYSHVIGGATCYSPMPLPVGKEAAKEDVVEAANELRRLYTDGKIDTPAYETALANLDANLKLYTDKEDNAVLRQLLLDLADGRSGGYF